MGCVTWIASAVNAVAFCDDELRPRNDGSRLLVIREVTTVQLSLRCQR